MQSDKSAGVEPLKVVCKTNFILARSSFTFVVQSVSGGYTRRIGRCYLEILDATKNISSVYFSIVLFLVARKTHMNEKKICNNDVGN